MQAQNPGGIRIALPGITVDHYTELHVESGSHHRAAAGAPDRGRPALTIAFPPPHGSARSMQALFRWLRTTALTAQYLAQLIVGYRRSGQFP
jgi:hypothetical protein